MIEGVSVLVCTCLLQWRTDPPEMSYNCFGDKQELV